MIVLILLKYFYFVMEPAESETVGNELSTSTMRKDWTSKLKIKIIFNN